MPSKHIIPSVILYTVAVIVTSISLANSQLQINIDPDSFAESNVSSDDSFIDTKSYVNCERVKRLLSLDDSLFDLGIVLEKCWHHGVTLDELERGIASVPERPDVQNYNYQDFYVSCDEVFSYNVTKLTTRLLQDFLDCESANAIATDVQSSMNESFADIIDVYLNGNSSVAIDTETLVPCYNSSKDITLLCRRYGLTQYQISTGFLRYHYNDKWIVEEDIDELSLTCDTIFNAKLEDQAYDDPSRAFLSCLNSGQIIDPERRDGFEKRNAEDLMIVRDFYYPDTPIIDLRAYVSCRRLVPIRVTNVLVSPSWDALEKCRTIGVTYPELQNGTEERFDDMKRFDDQIGEFYISCENVFTEELWSFTTGLLNDYEYCKKAGRITGAANAVIKKRFNKLFQLFTTQRNVSKKKKLTSITEHLVRCTNFTGRLQDLCRQRGSTLAQELRGLGSLARTLGDLWLNTEDLDRLYVRCDDIFGNYIKFLKDVPVDQYMQCRWVDELSEKSKAFIDRKIAGFYKDTHKWNGTSLRGGANGEIASQILFD